MLQKSTIRALHYASPLRASHLDYQRCSITPQPTTHKCVRGISLRAHVGLMLLQISHRGLLIVIWCWYARERRCWVEINIYSGRDRRGRSRQLSPRARPAPPAGQLMQTNAASRLTPHHAALSHSWKLMRASPAPGARNYIAVCVWGLLWNNVCRERNGALTARRGWQIIRSKLHTWKKNGRWFLHPAFLQCVCSSEKGLKNYGVCSIIPKWRGCKIELKKAKYGQEMKL
jgi:hypothetical protein